MLLVLVAVVQVTAARVAEPPSLDGRLDDAAWASAAAFTGFVQKDPDAGAPPSEPTSVRFLYTDDALWVGIDCAQLRSPVVGRLTRRDRDVDADGVELDLDTRGTGRDAVYFGVNAAGVMMDGLRYDDTEENRDWDENWEAQVARTATGYTVELRIPLRILRYPSSPAQAWGVQVRRYVSARQEVDELAPVPRGTAGEVSRYGRLGPLVDLPSVASLELRPFALSSIERARDGFTPRATAGGDLKWHVTPSLTFDATVNPDFAQVEADQRVLNLSTFETFYPEKRPFFLEGADVFSAPIMALYTRRIGRVPDEPALPATEALRAPPRPTALWGAAKLTGAIGDDTAIGALAALTGANRVDTDAGARLVDPWTGFAALRVRHGLGERGHVGAFATGVARFEGDRAYPIVDGMSLCPDGSVAALGARCTHDAVVGGADARWRSPGGGYVVDGDVAASAIHGGPPRLRRDGVVIASGDASPQARVRAAKEDDGLLFETVAELYGRRFDLDDAGYLERADLAHGSAVIGWQDSVPGAILREHNTTLEVFGSRNWRGERLSGGVQLASHVTFANYWSVWSELHWRPWHFDDREVGDGTALERSGQLGWELSVDSDPRGPVVATWWHALYLHPRGVEYSGNGNLTIHALPALDVELSPSVDLTRGEPRYALTLDDGRRAFGVQQARALGLTLRTTYTFTPRATLQVYGQIFDQRVAYRDPSVAPAALREVRLFDLEAAPGLMLDDRRTGVTLDASAVLRWEWRLGSLLYVVYSRAQADDTTQALLVKLSYWWAD